MPGILYTAYQKFYSALDSLEQFDKEKDFFENISSLDKFFAEFRNITFVLQKAIAHTEYEELYEKNRNEYLSNAKWFIDKRNQVTKQKPFELVKQIEISIYRPYREIGVLSSIFTVEDDVELASLLDDLKEFLSSEKTIEVFFSAKFLFYEKNTQVDLYEKLMSGIRAMDKFLIAMKKDIGEKCQLCDSLEKKIKDMRFTLLPRDILFDIDYVYYPLKDEFERGGRVAMMFGTNGQMPRVPLSNLDSGIFSKAGKNYFEKFILMNISIKSADLMPVVWIIYPDGTFAMDVFHSDIKTTMYRKVNECGEKILESDAKEIYCMMTYSLCDLKEIKPEMTSKERIMHGKEDYLTFVRIDEKLNEEEISFAGSKMTDLDYLRSQLRNGKKERLDLGRYNLMPIIEAFKQRNFNKYTQK